MKSVLNTFILEEIYSLPDNSYENIDFIEVNKKFTLLDFRLVRDEPITMPVAIELKEKFLESIWYLLRNDCRFLEHTFGNVSLQDSLDDIDMLLVMRTSTLPDNITPEDDILSYVNFLNLIFEDRMYSKNLLTSSYSFTGKLSSEQKFAIWRLIYAIFHYQLLKYAIINANYGVTKNIIIAFNDAKSQMDILKRLLSPVTNSINIAKYYGDMHTYITVGSRSEDEDATYLIRGSFSVAGNDEVIADIADIESCSSDYADNIVQLVTKRYINSL